MAKRTHYNILDLDEKLEIINLSEQNTKVRELCEKFNCGKTQIYEILKHKDRIRQEWLDGTGNRKRKKKPENEDIDKIIWEWFVNAKSQNLPVSGPILQSQAKIVAEKLGRTDFKASNGWLVSFKKRHNIYCKPENATKVGKKDLLAWKEKLAGIVEGYDAKDIFNCNETTVFYKAIPPKLSVHIGEKTSEKKLCKDRLTVLLCYNMDGVMERPVIIGKTENLEYYGNQKLSDLPVIWKFNNRAWMTTEIVDEWLNDLNDKMKCENRRILLFLDNLTCHPHTELSHIKPCFLPSNGTILRQPLGQSVIYSLKFKYRQLLLQYLASMSNGYESNDITVIDAIDMLSRAYYNILPHTVLKCFKKAGFSINLNEKVVNSDVENVVIELQPMLDSMESSEMCSFDSVTSDGESGMETNIRCVQDFINIDQNINDITDTKLGDGNAITNKIQSYEEALLYVQQLQDFAVRNNNNVLVTLLNEVQGETVRSINTKNVTKQAILPNLWS